jgi:hypothetical protein
MTAILGISAFYHDSAAALVIDGQIVAIYDETEIEDNISVGDNVIALVALDDNAALTLLEVQLSQESDGDLDDQPEADFVEIEFTGEVESIDTNVWVVAGERLQIDINSDIDDDISVGDSVVVRAEQRLEGLYALDIELIEADHDDSEESEDADAEDDEADDETDDEMGSEEDHEEAEEEDDEADEDDEEEEEEEEEEDEEEDES